MQNLYPTFIGLFGTISAISVAYLVLLYEQASKRRKSAKNGVLFEVEGSLHCNRFVTKTGLKADNELRDNLLDNCHLRSLSESVVQELQSILKKTFEDLRGTDIDTVDMSAAGERAEVARHIEKYHFDDTQRALDEFSKSETFYQEFPARSKVAVGIPLAICGYLISYSTFSDLVTNLKVQTFFFWFNYFVVIAGLFFVYWATTSTLNKLKGD